MKKSNFQIILMILIIFILLFVSSGNGSAEYLLPTTSPNPVGSGARALGMGGAFIGVADDATAASWNPGGMTQLKKPEISVVGRYAARTEEFENDGYRSSICNEGTDLNYLSVVYPFSILQRNMVLAANYQQLFDLDLKLKYKENIFDYNYERTGNLSPIGVSYSVQIVPKFSAGVTFNFWRDIFNANTIKETTVAIYNSQPFGTVTTKSKLKGFNSNWGIFFRPFESASIGLVYKTQFKADIDMAISTIDEETEPSNKKIKLEMPESYGIGLSYKFTDMFKVSADVYRTDWSDYTLKIDNGPAQSGVTGNPLNESHVKDTMQIRTGLEYLLIDKVKHAVVPLRFGLFYDPVPDQGSPINVYGTSAGTGYSTARFAVDVLYQYKASDGESSMTDMDDWVPDKFYEHTVYMSLIYYIF